MEPFDMLDITEMKLHKELGDHPYKSAIYRYRNASGRSHRRFGFDR